MEIGRERVRERAGERESVRARAGEPDRDSKSRRAKEGGRGREWQIERGRA